MKKILTLLLIAMGLVAAGSITVLAQLPEGYIEVPSQRGIPMQGLGSGIAPCSIGEDGVYDKEKLQKLFFRKECEDSVKALDLDLSKQTLVGYSVGGDCHMHVRIRTYRSDKDKKYLTIINNIYGGCRAGGGRSGWIILDKMPDGYTLVVKEVKVDRIDRSGADSFLFPKQPTGIPPEVLESSEVDIRGCLPMTGQSQWVFIKPEFLTAGLDRYPDQKAECAAIFDQLNIDFEKYDLAGYNLNTGDCTRPAGIEQRLVKDYDEMVYRLEITYPRRTGSCHVIKYHPVWVLVPKPPTGYSFRIETKVREK
ncbi:MAG: hypothetical protein ABIP75_14550 [Pyrinomonadaceae bacterium]